MCDLCDDDTGCDDCGELSGHDAGCPALCPVCKTRERERVPDCPAFRFRTCRECEDGDPGGEAWAAGFARNH